MFELIISVVWLITLAVTVFIAWTYIRGREDEIQSLRKRLDQEARDRNVYINTARIDIEKFWKSQFENWKLTDGQKMVDKSVNASRAIIRGKGMENVAAFLPEFKYLPSDSRFLGSPVDMLVFNNMSSVRDGRGGEIEIVFLDVKTGDSNLTPVQRKIKEAVAFKRVRWETLKI